MKMRTKWMLWMMPIAVAWVERHERRILREGVPLDDKQLADAVSMGVANPERIRIMEVSRIPLLNGLLVQLGSRIFPSISSHTIGLCLRYGIYYRLPKRRLEVRQLIAHECVHTGQYERAGSVKAFLDRYFNDCIRLGYPSAPWEIEAVERAAALDG